MKRRRYRGAAWVLALCLAAGLCAPAAAADGYTRLETLRVAVNGDIYQSMALLEEAGGKVWLPAATVEEFLGTCPESREVDGILWGDVSAAADSCVYDEALDSLYIWDGLPEVGEAAEVLYPEFGEPLDRPLTYREFFGMMDAAVKLADPEKLEQWQTVLPQARVSERGMSRVEGMEALLYLAVTLGDEYSEFNTDWGAIHTEMGDSVWTETEAVPYYRDLLPDSYPYDLGGFKESPYVYEGWDAQSVGFHYAYARLSRISGQPLFDYDRQARSLHLDHPLTARAAVTALTRLLDSAEVAGRTELDDPAVTRYDGSIITPELLAWAEEMPPVSASTLWNGAVLGGEPTVRDLKVEDTGRFMKKMSEYGFNCVRYMLNYQSLFDQRVTKADLGKLRELDRIVAYAARCRIHLNLCFLTMPGRWAVNNEDYSCSGEVDLFTNSERQEEARAVCRLLARRYAGIPSEILSFNPLWEVLNQNLSTDLPVQSYTPEDVAAVYANLAEVIRQWDPDRFLIYEPTAGNDARQTVAESTAIKAAMEPLGNVQMLTNYCLTEYVYSVMPDPAELGNVDNCTHAMFKPEYPLIRYFVPGLLSPAEPLIFNGDLPAGTRINIYLAEHSNGTLAALADGETVYEETLTAQVHEVGYKLAGMTPYAKSDRLVSFTLPQTAAELRLTFTGDQLQWSGMNVILPDAYAQQRWWFPSPYDKFLGIEDTAEVPELRWTSDILISPVGDVERSPVTIHADTLSYSSEYIFNQANRDIIDDWGRTISAFAPGSATRIERAAHSLGTQYSSALAYYGDVLDMCGKYGIGWFTNDFAFEEAFRFGQRDDLSSLAYAGAEYTPCADGQALREMLQLYQSHMPVQTPGSQMAVEYGDAPADGRLFLAGYDGDGRMCSLEEHGLAGNEGSFLFLPREGMSYRAFLLDGSLRPVGWVRIGGSPS